jgi:hypothetical protein
MANFFDAWRATQFGATGETLHALVDFKDDTIKASLIDTGTTDPDLATHQDWADLSTAEVGTGQTIGSVSSTITSNVWTFDGADVTLSSVTGNTAEEIVIWKDSGTASTSLLIADWDSGDVTNLPVTPNGGDITIQWNASGILSI